MKNQTVLWEPTHTAEAQIRNYVRNSDGLKGIMWVSPFDGRETTTEKKLDGLCWTWPLLVPVGHEMPFPGFPTENDPEYPRSTTVPVTESLADLCAEIAAKKGVKFREPSTEELDKRFRELLIETGFTPEQAAKAKRNQRVSPNGPVDCPPEPTREEWAKALAIQARKMRPSFLRRFFGNADAQVETI
jgi:hypothetical protein